MHSLARSAISVLAPRAAFAEQESKNSTHRAGISAAGSSGVIFTSVGGMVSCSAAGGLWEAQHWGGNAFSHGRRKRVMYMM